MELLSPSAWEGVGIVGFVIVMFLFHMMALKQGWIVFGPTHREIIRAKDETIAHAHGREADDARTISTLAETVAEQRISGEISTKLLNAMREIAGQS